MHDPARRPSWRHGSDGEIRVDAEGILVLPRIDRERVGVSHARADVPSDEVISLASIALGEALRALAKDDPAGWLRDRARARRVRMLRRLVATDPHDPERARALRRAILTQSLSSELANDLLGSIQRYLRLRQSFPSPR